MGLPVVAVNSTRPNTLKVSVGKLPQLGWCLGIRFAGRTRFDLLVEML